MTDAVDELAQVNIARLKAPLDSPQLKDFVDALDPVNATADAAEGFVWRLQSESGNATDVPFFGDDWLIVNLTVWRDANALTAFMYQGRHREMLARRRVGVPPRLKAVGEVRAPRGGGHHPVVGPGGAPADGGGGGVAAAAPADARADAVRVHAADVVPGGVVGAGAGRGAGGAGLLGLGT